MDIVYHSLSGAYEFFYKRLHKGLAFEITDRERVTLVDKKEHPRIDKVEYLYKLYTKENYGMLYSEGTNVLNVLNKLNDSIITNMIIKQREGIYIIEIAKNVYALIELGDALYGRNELRPCIYVKGFAFDVPLIGKIIDDEKFMNAINRLKDIFNSN